MSNFQPSYLDSVLRSAKAVTRWLPLVIVAASLDLSGSATAEELYRATPLTKPMQFTPGIEGPVADGDGNVYAVNFAEQQTIGRVSQDGAASVFVRLPGKSVGNGLRFDSHGALFVADYVGHNVLKIDTKTRQVQVLAHQPKMNQPNDLAIGPDDTLYASDPNWRDGTGQLWKITPSGEVHRLAANMGTTNGIEVSPDGKLLYVNESQQRNIWAFDLSAEGVENKRLLCKFDDFGFDGMRCDVDGNLYVTRYGKGTVAVVSPKGEVIREVDVLGARPSNICFGGPDGRTAFVTEVEHQRLVKFRVEKPGATWTRLHAPRLK